MLHPGKHAVFSVVLIVSLKNRFELGLLHKNINEIYSDLCPFIRISSRDTGKTMVDASLGEIMTTCEKINWLLSEGEKCLKPEYRYLSQSFLCFTNNFIILL